MTLERHFESLEDSSGNGTSGDLTTYLLATLVLYLEKIAGIENGLQTSQGNSSEG